ncbi:MAG: S41 family peptidase, partial [Coriobacteriia bacterium]|nr:S41 family peptidase [Coriobacteriia bacterium]
GNSTFGGSGEPSEFGDRINEVMRILNRNALHVYTDDEIDAATRAAIDGLLDAGGDIRSQYFNDEELQAYMADSSGEYVGIGITLAQGPDGRAVVTRVFSNSPASEDGVEPGDIIVAIDGVRRTWDVDEAVRTIRRPEGSAVEIIWERNGEERVSTIRVRTIQRDIVRYDVIEYEGLKVGYILLEQFTMNCAVEVRAAIKDLERQGVDCYILDLRDNPGGYLRQAIEIASMFIKSGVVVRIEERNSSSEEKVFGQHETNKPLVVLLNGESASASELVAAAFQDHGRAIIVGELSYGKGTVQDMRFLSFGGAIKFTIANYLTPNGHAVDGIGVTPDIIVDDGIRINDVDIVHRLENGEEIDFKAEGIDIDDYAARALIPTPGDPRYVYTPGDDVQLDAALKALSEMTE